MHNKVIGISAFGINDGIYIEDRDLGIKDFIPSVVIEDYDNKVFMYSNSAKFDKTGLNLDRDSYDRKNDSRKLVAFLWQQLEFSDEKTYQAQLLYKYIIETIKESLTSDDTLKNILSIQELKSNYTFVLCIPDTCGASEQDALLRAFYGYDIKLVWRSVASLLAYFEDQSIQKEPADSISVLYLGPDSIDIIDYGIENIEHNSKLYSVPKRHKPVYERNQIPLNGTDLSIALVSHIISAKYPNIIKSLKDKFVNQILYRYSSIWGGDSNNDGVNTLFCKIDSRFEYRTVSFDNNINYSDIRYSSNIDTVYKDNGILNIDYKKTDNIFIYEQLRNLIYEKAVSPVVLCTGPLVDSKLISDYIIDYVSNRHFSKSFVNCSDMALGAVIFQKRQINEEPTYKEKIDKFSYIASNETNDGYTAVTLLKDDYIEPAKSKKSDSIPLLLRKGSRQIKLLVSNDNKFNQNVLDKANTTSFKDQGVRVLTATPKTFKKEVNDDINVLVHIEQRLLSGYIKVIITPTDEKENEYIPRGGISVAFDKEHQTVYEDTLECRNKSYNDYNVKPLCGDIFKVNRLKQDYFRNTFQKDKNSKYHSSSACFYNKYDKVDESIIRYIDDYNTRNHCSSITEIKDMNILIDIGYTSQKIKDEIEQILKYNKLDKKTFKNLLSSYIYLMNDDDIEDVILMLRKFITLKATAYEILSMCRSIVMYNPRLFNPKSKKFNFPQTLKDLMYNTADSFLNDKTERNNFTFDLKKNHDLSIKGKNKVSVALSTYIYVLWYRKEKAGRFFLTAESEISHINKTVSSVIDCYRNYYSKLFDDSNNRYIKAKNVALDFINKLELIQKTLLDLLNKKGSDIDILSIVESFIEEKDNNSPDEN